MTGVDAVPRGQRRSWPGSRLGKPSTVFWIASAFAALLSILWALAGPVFSVPDENAHAVKAIAQLRG